MQKEIYQTYEFLPTPNTQIATDNQYILVQNDNRTFFSITCKEQYVLINNKVNKVENGDGAEVQYLTQVENVKEDTPNVQTCPVYDISQQQYYVDVNNSTELVQDAMILSAEVANNVFTNGYLLQTVPENAGNEATEVIKEDSAPPDIDTHIPNNQMDTAEAYTEITLNEEQCKIFEDNGWILLELTDKVFVLNTLGLLDITGNEKLIQKYKDASLNIDSNENFNNHNEKFIAKDHGANINTLIETPDETLSTVKCENNNNTAETNSLTESGAALQVLSTSSPSPLKSEPQSITFNKISMDNKEKLQQMLKNNVKSKRTICLNTTLAAKDIPKKIFIGCMSNGKKLYARVKASGADNDKSTTDKYQVIVTLPKLKKEIASQKSSTPSPATYSCNQQFKEELERALDYVSSHGQYTCTAEDLSTAECTVSQLLKIDTVRQVMIDRNVVITKVQTRQLEKDNVVTSESEFKCILTGRVARFDDNNDSWHFIYVPHLITKLLKHNIDCDEFEMSVCGEPLPRRVNAQIEDFMIHVHIRESTHATQPPQTIVTVTTQKLPWQHTQPTKRRSALCSYACSACAARFETQKDLSDHQQELCIQFNDNVEESHKLLTNGSLNMSAPLLIIDKDGSASYSCQYCQATFSRYSNCCRHITVHCPMSNQSTDSESIDENDKNDKPKNPKQKTYKCKMCPSSFYYAPTLTKHIMLRHVNPT